MRIALLGAGSVGTILGALLSRTGADIVLVDSYEEHVDALNLHGAKIVGLIDRTIPVTAILPSELKATYDLIISTTKQTDLQESLHHALNHMHDDSVVLTLQNGVPEEIAEQVVGPGRVMGGGVGFCATWLEPGVTELTSDESSLEITFGQPDGRITEKTRDVARILSQFGQASITTNIRGVRYSKLTDNATFSAMSTVLACSNGTILDSYPAMTCIAHLGREAGLIIQRLKITPEKIFGFQPIIDNVGFTTKKEMDEVIYDYWTPIYTPFRAGVASMLQDIEKGKKCEIKQINGKFVELGEELGVEVPFMKTVVDIVTRMQDGELRLEHAWKNLALFHNPELS